MLVPPALLRRTNCPCRFEPVILCSKMSRFLFTTLDNTRQHLQAAQATDKTSALFTAPRSLGRGGGTTGMTLRTRVAKSPKAPARGRCTWPHRCFHRRPQTLLFLRRRRGGGPSQLLAVPPQERVLRGRPEHVGRGLSGQRAGGGAQRLPERHRGGQQRRRPGVQRGVDPRRRSLKRHVGPVERAAGHQHVADQRLDGRLAHQANEEELLDDLRADCP